MRPLAEGAVAGTYGAAAMSILRMGARRAGVLDRPVPHAIVDSLVGRARRNRRGARAQVLGSELVHLLYGATWGALYGLVAGKSRHWVRGGLLLAAAQWAIGATARLPGFTEPRRPVRAEPGAKAVNALTHVVHGLATALTASELNKVARQRVWRSPGERVG